MAASDLAIIQRPATATGIAVVVEFPRQRKNEAVVT
jgi:hypothetical protein